MIKQINRQNILLSPFAAIKSWNLFNTKNDSLVLIEPLSNSVDVDNTAVAVDYIDYSGIPTLNRECNIALEQQEEDLATYEEGISGSGNFFPDSEAQNDNGTFKRLVYSQMQLSFYNKYKNPLQIYGIENIDFPLSETNRYVADSFLMFTVPRYIMGDRIVKGSIQMTDNSLDDNLTIYDDSNGNLNAGSDLFSRIQEVRHIDNIILSGSVVDGC